MAYSGFKPKPGPERYLGIVAAILTICFSAWSLLLGVLTVVDAHLKPKGIAGLVLGVGALVTLVGAILLLTKMWQTGAMVVLIASAATAVANLALVFGLFEEDEVGTGRWDYFLFPVLAVLVLELLGWIRPTAKLVGRAPWRTSLAVSSTPAGYSPQQNRPPSW